MITRIERIWQLVSLKLSGEATPEELEELDALIKNDPKLRSQIEVMEKIWNNNQNLSAHLIEESLNRHLLRLGDALSDPVFQNKEEDFDKGVILYSERSRPFYKRAWLTASIAASLLAVALLLVFWMHKGNNTHTASSQNVVSTKPGSKSKIQLPDGTQVWLNADSKLTYKEHFEGKYREVILIGEAYFDVVEDKTRPFIIHTNSIDVKVLGTAFNVRSYPDDQTIETALVRGSVEVTLHSDSSKKIILRPNEKLMVQQNTGTSDQVVRKQNTFKEKTPTITISPMHNLEADNTSYETSWIKNKLSFDGESLEQVALKIERWFGVKVAINNDRLKKEVFTGLYEDESLSEVLAALQLSGKFHYSINRKEVSIWP